MAHTVNGSVPSITPWCAVPVVGEMDSQIKGRGKQTSKAKVEMVRVCRAVSRGVRR
ncbi:hypothetical protein ACWD3I_29455 [Streptomyces sp. NPDC002817]|uniref:hypothetical protein n=1 Tax=Streptomyces sp. NPDC088357 TaxID=3154655 RepID=UPI00342E45C9